MYDEYSDEWSESEDEETQKQQAAVWAQLVGEKSENSKKRPVCTCGLIPCLCEDDLVFSLPATEKEKPGLVLNPDEGKEAEHLSPLISEKLKPHQVQGVRFMWERVIKPASTEVARGCILADHMGLGKTLQLIATISTFFQKTSRGTALVIAPAFVLGNWEAEILKWTGCESPLETDLRVRTLKTTPCTRASRLATIDAWRSEGGTLLIGYEMFRHLVLRGESALAGDVSTKKKKKRSSAQCNEDARICSFLISAGLLVLDEAHRLKDPKSQVYRALSRVRTSRRILASGYPIQNRLDEYWALCDFARPGVLGSYENFRAFFEKKIDTYVEAQSNHDPNDASDTSVLAKCRSEALERAYALQYALNDVVLRRGIEELGSELPPRTDWIIHCELGQTQHDLYHAFEVFNQNIIGELASYHATLAIVNHPDIVHLALQEEDDALNNHTDMIDEAEEELISNLEQNDGWYIPELEESRRKRIDSQRERSEKKRAKIRQKIQAKNRSAILTGPQENFAAAPAGFTSSPDMKKFEEEFIKDERDETDTDDLLLPGWSEETELAAWARPVLRTGPEPYEIGQSDGPHGSGKATVALELILAASKRKERVIVFTQTLGTLDVLERLLEPHEIRVARVDGATALTKRTSLIAAINRDEDQRKTRPKHLALKKKSKRPKTTSNTQECDVLLMSIKAGGEGINLVGASRVILFDVCWNPCFDQQALSRAHRFGQTRHVHVYRLVGPDGTMEDRVLRQQRRKELLVRQVADVGTHRENEPYVDLRRVYPLDEQKASQEPIQIADDLLSDVINTVGSEWVSTIHQSTLEDPTLSSTRALLDDADKSRALEDYRAFVASIPFSSSASSSGELL